MIFYFTGTGNSLWVARELGRAFDEPLISIATELARDEKELVYPVRQDEAVYFVYPVHSWGMPLPVSTFISRLRLEGYTNQFVYSISTCGDECGFTNRIIRKALGNRGIALSAFYSIQMPNNYVLLPGFDVDTKEVETEKLQQAPLRLKPIMEAIRLHSFTHLYKRGSLPFLKSRIIYPLFIRYALRNNKFHVSDACTSCGLCEKKCPSGTITLREDGRPQWAKESCVQCLACFHYCPVRAIEYGKTSLKKGRYHHPEIK